MRINLDDLPPRHKAAVLRQLEAGSKVRSADTNPIVEPDQGDALEEDKEDRRCSPRYHIHVHCRAVRLLDWDNFYIKPIQDAITRSGLFWPDDNPSEVWGHATQEKVATYEEEETIVTIYEEQ